MFLGVDGGGTKTALCLITADGEVVAATEAESTYWISEGTGLVARVLEAGVRTVCEQAAIHPDDIAFGFFGLPAYGEVADAVPALDAAPRPALGHDRYRCDNDMVCGWAGSLAAADGINVISGTGSMTYGRRGQTGVRVGGWGERFGDDGSAHWIAIRGLNLFSRMSDGRLDRGPLYDGLRSHLGLTTDLELVDVVLHRWRSDRGRIAGLSRQVAAAADRGDARAAEVLAEAGAELAELAHATARRLGYGPGERVPVSYSGGAFSAPGVRRAFRAALGDQFELRRPRYLPVVGAALYAATLAGTPLAAAALRRLDEAARRPEPPE